MYRHPRRPRRLVWDSSKQDFVEIHKLPASPKIGLPANPFWDKALAHNKHGIKLLPPNPENWKLPL